MVHLLISMPLDSSVASMVTYILDIVLCMISVTTSYCASMLDALMVTMDATF